MDRNAKIDAVKKITRFVVQIGASKIAGAIIADAITPETVIEKITVYTASYVLGGLVANAAATHSDKIIDDLVAIYDKARASSKTATTPES